MGKTQTKGRSKPSPTKINRQIFVTHSRNAGYVTPLKNQYNRFYQRHRTGGAIVECGCGTPIGSTCSIKNRFGFQRYGTCRPITEDDDSCFLRRKSNLVKNE